MTIAAAHFSPDQSFCSRSALKVLKTKLNVLVGLLLTATIAIKPNGKLCQLYQLLVF